LGHGFFYIPGTDTALKIGGHVRFATEFGDDRSPEYTVTKNPVMPEIVLPSLSRKGDDMRLPYIAEPLSEIQLQRAPNLSDFLLRETKTTTPFGTGYYKDCLPEPIGLFYAWRLQVALALAIVLPDFYYVPIGPTWTLYPGWNDKIFRGTTFTLDPLTGTAAEAMAGAIMHAHTSAILSSTVTFDNTTFTYRLLQNAILVAVLQTVVYPDLVRAGNPPVIADANGFPVVTVPCLVLGGKNYPRIQFRRAKAEPINPITGSGCEFIHWHGPRVYHLDGDLTGITDPFPHNCGFGATLLVPQVNVTIPFAQWLVFLFAPRSSPSPAVPTSLNEVVCGPETAGR
jgi:hypothetical protein